MKKRVRQVATGLLVSAVGASSAGVTEAQEVRALGDRPSCPSCSFAWTDVGTVPGATGDAPATLFAVSIARNTLYYVDLTDRGLVKAAALSDGSTSVIGRKGGGPGEYEVVRNLILDGGDNLVLIDGALARASIFSPSGRHLAGQSMEVSGGVGLAALMLRSGRLILNIRPTASPNESPTVVLYDRRGRVSTTVESIPAGAANAYASRRHLAAVNDSSFVSVDPFRFVVTMYSVSGDRVVAGVQFRLQKADLWRPGAHDAPSDGLFDTPYASRIRAAWVDEDGLLWLYSANPSDQWKPRDRPKPGERSSQGFFEELSKRPIVASTIEAFELSTGTLLVRQRVDGSLGHAIGGGLFVRSTEDSFGEPLLTIRRVSLVSP